MERLQSYFWITKSGKVFETRGLNTKDQIKVVEERFCDDARDFTSYLSNWAGIRAKLGEDAAQNAAPARR